MFDIKSIKTRNAMFAAATSAIAMPTRLIRFLSVLEFGRCPRLIHPGPAVSVRSDIPPSGGVHPAR